MLWWSSETFLLPEKWKNTVKNINDSIATNIRKKEKFSWKTFFLTSMLDFCHYSLMVLFSFSFFLTNKYLTSAKKNMLFKRKWWNSIKYLWILLNVRNIIEYFNKIKDDSINPEWLFDEGKFIFVRLPFSKSIEKFIKNLSRSLLYK